MGKRVVVSDAVLADVMHCALTGDITMSINTLAQALWGLMRPCGIHIAIPDDLFGWWQNAPWSDIAAYLLKLYNEQEDDHV